MADYLRSVADQLDKEHGERDCLAILVRDGGDISQSNPAYAFATDSCKAQRRTDEQLLTHLKELVEHERA